MKPIKIALSLLLVLMVASCSNKSENLERMIPADVTGVVSINVPEILEKSSIAVNGKLQIPPSLTPIIDENDASVLCEVITDLPHMGIDPESKAFVFFTQKTFASVLLVSLDDEEVARKAMERRSGGDFATVDGLDCIYVKDNFYAIKDHVLLIGHVNKSVPVEKAASASKAFLAQANKSILDNDDVKERLEAEGAVNAYLELPAVKSLLRKSTTYKELSQKLPLLDLFVESDIKALVCNIVLDEKEAKLSTTILADEGSDYLQLMNTIMSEPGEAVLKTIPNSMDYMVSMSVKGDQFVKLPQIQQLISLFKSFPYIGRIDIEGILSSIDGPLAVGVARDPHLEGEWNVVVAAKSTNPESILKSISTFASALGQAPEIYDGEYIYQYDNKMIKMGVVDGVLYLKMLDYEQTEGYAYEMEPVRNLFAHSPMAVFVQTHNREANGYFEYGMTDHLNGAGRFYPKAEGGNATLELLKVLCSIKGAAAFDDADEDDADDVSLLVGDAIDKLHPVN